MTKSKRILTYSFTFGGILLTLIGMIGMVVIAMNGNNGSYSSGQVNAAWVFTGILFTGAFALVAGIIMYIVFNQEKLKELFHRKY